jgi:hypothetical protein
MTAKTGQTAGQRRAEGVAGGHAAADLSAVPARLGTESDRAGLADAHGQVMEQAVRSPATSLIAKPSPMTAIPGRPGRLGR